MKLSHYSKAVAAFFAPLFAEVAAQIKAGGLSDLEGFVNAALLGLLYSFLVYAVPNSPESTKVGEAHIEVVPHFTEPA